VNRRLEVFVVSAKLSEQPKLIQCMFVFIIVTLPERIMFQLNVYVARRSTTSRKNEN